MYNNQFSSFRLGVEPTSRCNLSCLHCFRVNQAVEVYDLPVALYEKFLREVRSYQTSTLTFTGGEPTLHPEFEAFLELAVRYGYQYLFVTNGWNFEQIYPVLSKYRQHVKGIYFSLDGAEEATHDRIRQLSGSYRRVLHAAMTCYVKQIPFYFSVALNRLNASEIEGILQLAARVGAGAVYMGVVQLTRQLVARDLACSPRERHEIEKTLLYIDENPHVKAYPTVDMFTENPCFPCFGLQNSLLQLDYKGRIRFCCQLSRNEHDHDDLQPDVLGSIATESLFELHRRLVRLTAQFQEDKIRRLEQGPLTVQEHFPCYYCAGYFGKLDWLQEFPDSPWHM